MADKDPTIPFYAQDFIVDTIQLPENLVGAYIRLLCVLWINKFCHYDAIALANVSPSAKEVVDLLKDKFTFDGEGKFTSNRLEEVRAKRLEIRAKRQEAGLIGLQKRWQRDSKGDSKEDSKKIAKVTVTETVTETINREYYLGIFNQFLPPELQQDWCYYLDYCYERKDIVLNKSTITEQVKFLRDNQKDAKKIMRQSIKNNWKGLFEVKNGTQGSNPKGGATDEQLAKLATKHYIEQQGKQ